MIDNITIIPNISYIISNISVVIFNSIQFNSNNFNYPTRGSFVVVMVFS